MFLVFCIFTSSLRNWSQSTVDLIVPLISLLFKTVFGKFGYTFFSLSKFQPDILMHLWHKCFKFYFCVSLKLILSFFNVLIFCSSITMLYTFFCIEFPDLDLKLSLTLKKVIIMLPFPMFLLIVFLLHTWEIVWTVLGKFGKTFISLLTLFVFVYFQLILILKCVFCHI